MWKEWQTAYLLHKVWHRDPRRMDGYSLIDMGVYNNAALAEVFFPESPIGTLTKGAKADIIFVDYQPHTPLTAGNLPWHIVFGFHESMVTMTMVEGQILMHDRKLLTLDEQGISAQALELAPKVWSRYQTQFSKDV
jgi:cytosine/adenosine deaminase-related metal-dependent hydrolase